jgi:hypothetical protein
MAQDIVAQIFEAADQKRRKRHGQYFQNRMLQTGKLLFTIILAFILPQKKACPPGQADRQFKFGIWKA